MAASDDVGFARSEMYSSSLGNTVEYYERHVFLCYKEPVDWPARLENSVDDPLPYFLSAAIKSRKDHLPVKTHLTIYGRCNGTEFTDGDVLIFPEMIKYKGLKESDVDGFVEDVLVQGKPWASGIPESLVGAYIFVCAHVSRDKRCGVCGPVLVEKFKEEIESKSLNDHVFVNACSHVGGHKYAGNLIIFGTDEKGKVIGDWYGYVTPADVPDLIDVHIGKGEIIEKLWRGQMGLKVEAAEEKVEDKPSNEKVEDKPSNGNALRETEEKAQGSESCCQGTNGVSCCRDGPAINGEREVTPKTTIEKSSEKQCSVCLPGWIGKWEQSDVLVAAGVIGAVATIAVAYTVFKRPS
ncbi:altered inheritance of mitochondria protein 32-like [Silene latifolia]|uniref:altered inheritance of mitochondria protein 32-like n=1 Tax=Silene latifolia TaxID=37657 RepID=UPI003D77F7F8